MHANSLPTSLKERLAAGLTFFGGNSGAAISSKEGLINLNDAIGGLVQQLEDDGQLLGVSSNETQPTILGGDIVTRTSSPRVQDNMAEHNGTVGMDDHSD